MMIKKTSTCRALIIILFVIALLFSLGTVSAQTSIDEATKSIVRIRVVTRGTNAAVAGNVIRQGSGFVIGDQPPFQYIATSWDVVRAGTIQNADIYVWRSADDFVPATIYVPLQQSNIALLRLDPEHHLFPYEPLQIGNRSMVNIGDDIYALGFPRDAQAARYQDVSVIKSIYSRTVNGRYVLEDRVQINTDVEGGPLLNTDGVVVGVAIRDVPGVAVGTSGGVDINALVDVLEGRGIAYLKAGTVPPVEEEEPVVVEPQPLPTAVNLNLSAEGLVSWDSVSGAQGYEIFLYRDGQSVYSASVGANTTLVDLSEKIDEFGAGIYTAQVKSIGGGDYLDGPLSSSSNAIEKKTGISPLIIGIGAAAALLIIMIVILATRGGGKKQASPVSSTAGAQGAVTQRTPSPVTQAKPEPVSAPVTKAKPIKPIALVKGVSGHFAGQSIEFVDGQLVIGRDPRFAQLVYPQTDEEISRKHLTIRYDERTNKFILEDSSSNGTFLSSNQRLENGKPYYLNPGDRFYLADPKESFELKKG